MFRPKFKILITKDNFYLDEAICLGSQLAVIVDFLAKILPPHIWYASDISAFSTAINQINFDSPFLKKVGYDSSLIKICSQINQFLSGVFLAINTIFIYNEEIEKTRVMTEDEQFRSLAINEVLIEIRTFDTSFFELYTENESFAKKLAEKFNAKILENSNLGH